MSRAASLVRVATCYVLWIAAFVAWVAWGPDAGSLLVNGLVADLIATLVVFAFSRYYKNSSFYDAYWSVLPPVLAIYWWVEGGSEVDARAWLVLGVITLWAVRLTGNWVYSWPGLHHEDWRYPLVKEKAGKAELLADLVGIHLVPTIQVFLGMLPVYAALTYAGRDVGWLDAVAVVVGVGAVALELVADLQLHRFVKERQPGAVMDRGLWGWSRHPNYFGEITFWCSLALFGIAASPGDWWWCLVGTVAMTAMFLGASIPMMERRSLERRPAYQEVIDRVPMLVPRPPRG